MREVLDSPRSSLGHNHASRNTIFNCLTDVHSNVKTTPLPIGTHVGFKHKRQAHDVGKVTGVKSVLTSVWNSNSWQNYGWQSTVEKKQEFHFEYTVELIPHSLPDCSREGCLGGVFGRQSTSLQVAEEDVYETAAPKYLIGQRVTASESCTSWYRQNGKKGYVIQRQTLRSETSSPETSKETDATPTTAYVYKVAEDSPSRDSNLFQKYQSDLDPSLQSCAYFFTRYTPWLSESDISDEGRMAVFSATCARLKAGRSSFFEDY